MIIDKRLQFSAAQAVTADAYSTDTIDLGSDRDVGPGRQLWVCMVSKATPGGTSPTLSLQIRTDDNSSFSSPTTLFTGPVLSAADMAAGKIHIFPMPMTNERHLAAYFDVGGTSPTFSLDVWLTDQHPTTWAAQPDGI